MIYIRKETLKFMRCQSCLTDKGLNNIKIQYPDSVQYQSITLCDNCIQHLVNLYQNRGCVITDEKFPDIDTSKYNIDENGNVLRSNKNE